MAGEEPLLQAYWRDLEATATREAETAGRDPPPCLNALQLQQQYPNQFIQYLKHQGIVHLGDTCVAATDLPGIFGGAAFATRGSKEPDLKDWFRDWAVCPAPCHSTAAAAEAGVVAEPAPATAPRAAAGASGVGSLGTAMHRTVGGVGASTRRVEVDAERIGAAGGGWWSRLRSFYEAGDLNAEAGGDGSGGIQAPRLRPRVPPPPVLPPPPTVVLEAYRINVHSAAAPGELGLLRPLLRRWQMGSCSAAAFGLPAVQAVVAYKWDRFARRLLLQQLGAYGLWLGAFTAFMLLFNSADAAMADRELLSTWQGRAAVAFEVVALVGMAPFAVSELCVLSAYGLRGWLTAWNMLDCATYGMQIAITVLHLGMFNNGPVWLTLAVAVQAVLLVIRLTYFSRVFRSTTFDFMGSLQAVSREVGWYVAVLLLLMWGFACAFYTIFRSDPAADSFGSLPMSLLTMLNYAVGGTSYYMRGLLASRHPAAAIVLCTIYQFLVSMLLMSLLTGVMTNALLRATQQEAVALVLNRAQVIDELETVLPPPLLAMLTSYSGDTPYVHVLRVSPHSLERLDGEGREADKWGLWHGGGGGGAAGANGDAGGGAGGEGSGGLGAAAAMAALKGESAAAAATDAPAPEPGGVARLETQVALLGAQVTRLEAREARLEEQLHQMHGLLRQLVGGGERHPP